MRGISPLKSRAQKQVRYKRETFFGVVAREVVTSAGTLYDVKLSGHKTPIRGVYNAAGFELQAGDPVTVQRVGGQRFSFQIVNRARGKPVDFRDEKYGVWDSFDWDDGTVWG